jgi:hypothetical protein
MKWTAHVHIGEMRIDNKISVGKPELKKLLGIPRNGGRIILKMFKISMV